MNQESLDNGYKMELSEDERLYIQLLQENITRMNTNSMNCKMFCITFVGAVVAIVATNQVIDFLWAAFVVSLGCYVLDVSYLKLEKDYRAIENRLLYEKKEWKKPIDFMFIFKASDVLKKNVVEQNWREAFSSWSTFPVYAVLLIAILIIIIFSKMYLA